MHNVKEMLDMYANKIKSYQYLEKIFNKTFDLKREHIEHTTKRYLMDVIVGRKNTYNYKSMFNSIGTLFLVFGYLICSFFFYRRHAKIDTEVVFDIFGNNTYDRYYKTIDKQLNGYSKVLFRENNNKFFNRKISIQLFYFLSKYSMVLLYLSFKHKFNFLDLTLRHCRKIALYITDTDHIECKCFISARDNTFNAMRYEIYKKNGINNILLIQGARRDTAKNAKSGDIYCYNDYYFGFGLELIKKMNGMKSNNLIPIGSIPLYDNSFFNKEVKYDIVIIEEPVFSPVTFTSKEKFDIMINHICKFKKENPCYNIYYTKKPNRFGEKEYVDAYYNRLEKLEIKISDSDINNSYDAINSSKLVIFQGSTMGLESVGLDKLIMHCNYPKYESHFDNNSLFVITDESYEVFRDKLTFLLNHMDLKKELSSLKYGYMNLSGNPANKVVQSINRILNKKV